MPTYKNGYVPESALTVFARGTNKVDGDWYHGLPPATYARHLALVALTLKRTGRVLRISEGWGAYRPYFAQVIARNIYGVGAAVPGTSSHGLFWEGRSTAAMDYSNWGDVYGWDRAAFFADCRAVGFTPNMISPGRGYPDEPWHVIDLDPWGPVPAGLDVTDFTIDEAAKEDEDDMKAIKQSGVDGSGVIIQPGIPPYSLDKQVFDALVGAYGLTVRELADWQYETAIREQWTAYSTAQKFAAKGSVNVDPAAVDAIVKGVRDSLGFTVTVEPS